MTLVRRGLSHRRAGAARSSRRPRATTRSCSTRWREVCDRIRGRRRRRARITVHGDYDVDGVCSTAILVRALRELGGDCDWLIPGRLEDGYGLTIGDRRAADASAAPALLITADCGIGSVDEVARGAGGRHRGDRHRPPPARRPSCPTARSCTRSSRGYPFAELCATGVAYKLAARSAGRRGGRARPRPRRAGDGRRPRPAARREPLPGAPRARGGPPGAAPGAARADRASARIVPERLDEGDIGSGLVRGSTPPAACTAPTPGSS